MIRRAWPSWLGMPLLLVLVQSGWLGGNVVAQPTVLYTTGFEPGQGFDIRYELIGQQGWIGTDTNGNGLVTNYFAGRGQQAYVGFSPLSGSNDTLSVWRPVNFNPVAAGKPVVRFTVTMTIFDSTNQYYDCFRWSVYNTNNGGTRLFTLDFDNATTNINYLLDDDQFASTGFTFVKEGQYDLEVTMNFASNLWSASLNGVLFVSAKPITTRGTPLNLGDIDAVWLHRLPGFPGDNFMVFDDYRITADTTPLPFGLEGLGQIGGGAFLLRLTGEQGRNYAVQASTDLSSWASIYTNTPSSSGSFDFLDTSAGALNRRFYRATVVP